MNNFYFNILGLKHVRLNKGYRDIKDKNIIRNDCAVVALSRILNIPYEEAYDKLAELGKKNHIIMNSSKIIIEIMESYGYTCKRIYAKDKLSVGEFMYNHKTGRFLVSSRDHIAAYINGTMYDTSPKGNLDLFIKERAIFIISDNRNGGKYERRKGVK